MDPSVRARSLMTSCSGWSPDAEPVNAAEASQAYTPVTQKEWGSRVVYYIHSFKYK